MQIRQLIKTLPPETDDNSSDFERIYDQEIPAIISDVLQKINQETLLSEEDLSSFDQALNQLNNETYDVIIYILCTLEMAVYSRYQAELSQSKNMIERHLLEGKPLPQLRGDSHYHGLLNLQKTKIVEFKNHHYANFEMMFKKYCMIERKKRNAAVGIQALILLGKLPVGSLTHLQPLPTIKQITDHLTEQVGGQAGVTNPFILFSKKKTDCGLTWVATNGKQMVYATKWFGYNDIFTASHSLADPVISDSPHLVRQHTSNKRTDYTISNQDVWNFYSDYVIKTTSHLLAQNDKYRNFERLMRFLGEKRQFIAQVLNHKRDKKKTHNFGRPRNNTVSEYISPDSAWHEIYPTIKNRINNEMHHFKKSHLPPHFGNHYQYPDICEYPDIRCVFRMTTSINLSEFFITYPRVNEDSFSQHCQQCQPEFDQLLNWDKKDLNEFIKQLGRLSYELYRQLPFFLGTSAIVMWLARSIAAYHQVDLGLRQDNPADLDLDWQAFVTFNKEEYAVWYVQHAFKEVSVKPGVSANEHQQINRLSSF